MPETEKISKPDPLRIPLWSGSRRHPALLGGTTTFSDFVGAIRCLMTPHRLIAGPDVGEYEKAFARTVGVRYACSFSAGRIGLYGLLKALGVGKGDEVLLQAPTHIVVSNAIRFSGARPVYVDCRLDDYNMDIGQAEKLISPRTRVLLLQHTFGIPADLDAALDLATRHRLILLEDCVHALGSRYRGRPVGSFGKAAFFSTEETKTISSTMGGMAVTDDASLAESMKAFQSRCAAAPVLLTIRYVLKFAIYYLLTNPYIHRYSRTIYDLMGQMQPLARPTSEEELLGIRSAVYEMRLSNAQAVLAGRQLRRLDSNLVHRKEIARAYRELLNSRRTALPHPNAEADSAYVRFPVWVSNRPAALKAAAPYGMPGTWFTSVLEEAVGPEYGDYIPGSCPRAEKAAQHLINLSTHPRVKLEDARMIAGAISHLAGDKSEAFEGDLPLHTQPSDSESIPLSSDQM